MGVWNLFPYPDCLGFCKTTTKPPQPDKQTRLSRSFPDSRKLPTGPSDFLRCEHSIPLYPKAATPRGTFSFSRAKTPPKPPAVVTKGPPSKWKPRCTDLHIHSSTEYRILKERAFFLAPHPFQCSLFLSTKKGYGNGCLRKAGRR